MNDTMLILANADSIHTFRWVKALSPYFKKIIIFSLENKKRIYSNFKNVEVYEGKSKIDTSLRDGHISKLSYLKNIFQVNRIIDEHNPKVIHAYYASSYGLLAYLSKAKSYHVSLWGSDVLRFPFKSPIHRIIFQLIMSKADKVFSTSKIMIEVAKTLWSRDYIQIPFGIDINFFHKTKEPFGNDQISIGIAKSLEKIYGIDLLIEAVARLLGRNINIKLKIAGQGSQENQLKLLTSNFNISNNVEFCSSLDHFDLVDFYNSIDIACFPSRSESFGVSVLEANACERPVVVSNVGGLPEIVCNSVNGLVINNEVENICKAIEELINNKEYALEMGKKGRKLVENQYQWQDCVKLKRMNLLVNRN